MAEAGRANTALETLIADWLGVGRRSVEVTGGHTSRHKTVTIAGQPECLLQTITTRLAAIQQRSSDAGTDH